jgi:hypothetical protein
MPLRFLVLFELFGCLWQILSKLDVKTNALAAVLHMLEQKWAIYDTKVRQVVWTKHSVDKFRNRSDRPRT